MEGSADGAGSADENVVAGSALRASHRDLVSFVFASVCLRSLNRAAYSLDISFPKDRKA